MQQFKKDQQIPLTQVTDPNTGQVYYSPQNVVYNDKNGNGPQYLRNVIVDQATTASYFSGSITNAVSASYAATASYFSGSITNAISASYAATASYATNFFVSGSITGVDYIDFDTTATVTQPTTARLSWNNTDGTLDLGLKGGNVTLQIGQETLARVVNKSGGDLLEADFQIVRIRSVAEGGAQGQRLAVVLAQADSDADSATTLGVVTETILNNQEGFITIFGTVRGIDTTGAKSYGGLETWVDGDMLYLSPDYPGYLTNVKPIAPQHLVIVGYVEYAHANNGKIFVKIDNGWEIGELHDVLDNTTTSSYGDLLVKSGSVWTNSRQLTGSYAITGSLTATSFTGSFSGSGTITSASYAVQAGNSNTINVNSFGSPVESYLLMSNVVATTGVAIGGDADLRYNSSTNVLTVPNISATSITGSFSGSGTITTSSFALTASYVNPLRQDVQITGSTRITGSLNVVGQVLSNDTFVSTAVYPNPIGFATSGSAAYGTGFYTNIWRGTINYPPVSFVANAYSASTTNYALIATRPSTPTFSQFQLYVKADNTSVINLNGGGPILDIAANDTVYSRFDGTNFSIGTTSALARLHSRGTGTTSATTALRVENSSATPSMVVLDNGNVGIRTSSPSDNLTVIGSTALYAGQTTITGATSGSGTTLLVRNLANTPALTITNVRSSSFNGNVDIAGDLSATNSSGTRKFQSGYYHDIHPEAANASIIPFYSNDLAYNTLRGGSVSASFGPGSTYTLNNSQIEALFDGSSNYCIMNPMELSGSATFTITFPQSYLYGNIIGFSFGNGSWVARDFTVEILVTGSYVTLDTQTGYTAANYTKFFGYGVNAATGARITFSNFVSPTNGAGFRIAEIFLLNYNSQLGKAVFVGRDGGSIYKPIYLPSGSVSVPSYSSLTDTNTGIYFPAADTLGFVEGGAEAMRINSSGQVGIGTTSSISRLSVVDSSGYSPSLNATASANFNVARGTTFATNLVFTLSGSSPFTAAIQHRHASLDGYSYPISLNPLGGNVGIGTNSPSTTLNVNGTTLLQGGQTTVRGSGTTSATTALRVENTNASASLVVLDNGSVYSFGPKFIASNTAFGVSAHLNLDSGSNNTAFGTNTGYAITNGVANTSIGSNAHRFLTTGNNNVALGSLALYTNVSGSNNVAVGASALNSVTSNNNIAIGSSTLFNTTTGDSNTAVGHAALLSNVIGSYQTGIGYASLINLNTGSNNTALGLNAGRYVAPSTSPLSSSGESVFIGVNSRANANGETNQIVIGYDANGIGSNSVVLGNNSITRTALKGSVGIGTTSPSASLDVSGSGRFTNGLTVTGSLIATSFTGSLQGTASYAVQALSASWAPGGTPFPYTGSAQITGSLTVTGPFIVNDGTVNLIDTTAYLLNSNTGDVSIDWGSRLLVGSIGNSNLNWDADGNNGVAYLRRGYFKTEASDPVQETFSAAPFNCEGKVIQGVRFEAAVSDYNYVSLQSNGKWTTASFQDTTAKGMLGIAFDVGSRDSVLLEGHITVADVIGYSCPIVANAGHGKPIYLYGPVSSSTTPPTLASSYSRILGHIYYNNTSDTKLWIMNFRPDHSWTEL